MRIVQLVLRAASECMFPSQFYTDITSPVESLDSLRESLSDFEQEIDVLSLKEQSFLYRSLCAVLKCANLTIEVMMHCYFCKFKLNVNVLLMCQ
jgi:hypothetical protein